MKYIIEILRTFFVSPEFVLILMGISLCTTFSQRISSVGEWLSDSNDIIKYVGLLPVLVLIKVFPDAVIVLWPENDKRQLLQNWPSYWKLKIVFYVTLIYASLFGTAGFLTWIIKWDFSNKDVIIFVVQCVSVLGSIIVYLSVYNAKIKVREIFAKH